MINYNDDREGRYLLVVSCRTLSHFARTSLPYLQVRCTVATNPRAEEPWLHHFHWTCCAISAISAATQPFTSKRWIVTSVFTRASGRISASYAPGRSHRSATWSCTCGGTVPVPTGAGSATEFSGMVNSSTSTCNRSMQPAFERCSRTASSRDISASVRQHRMQLLLLFQSQHLYQPPFCLHWHRIVDDCLKKVPVHGAFIGFHTTRFWSIYIMHGFTLLHTARPVPFLSETLCLSWHPTDFLIV